MRTSRNKEIKKEKKKRRKLEKDNINAVRHRINYITPDEWLPKSPDATPMDHAIWAYLKRRLNKTETKTTDELKKSFYVSR